jgi:hypothetical protein
MAGRSRPPKRRINWVQVGVLVISFLVVLSMILSMLPLAQ